MRVLLINAVCGIRSTGRICTQIAEELEKDGHEVKIAYGRCKVPEEHRRYAVRIGSLISVLWHALLSRLFDMRGQGSRLATRRFLKWAEEYDPEVLWLHNLHDHYINTDLLFEWIKKRPGMQVRWTQHDCWAFTGSCMHYMQDACTQWQTECLKCPSGCTFPKGTLIRRPKANYLRKKNAFSGVLNMLIICPSQWMEKQIGQSFLRDCRRSVCRNTVDADVFKLRKSDLRQRYGLEDKRIILGAASSWTEKKGLYDFYELASRLCTGFAVVLVGLTKKQIRRLPDNIIGIERSNDASFLAECYSSADLFLNLSHEENYPTVNLEAQSCKAVCLCYDVGGSSETVPAGNALPVGDMDALIARIKEILDE